MLEELTYLPRKRSKSIL